MGRDGASMGLFDDEIAPGHDLLRPCPECDEDEMYRTSEGTFEPNRYVCDSCGYLSSKEEVQKSVRESVRANNSSVEDMHEMKLKPELSENEEVKFVGTYSEHQGTNNAILAITSTHLYTRPKKGAQINVFGNLMGTTEEDFIRDLPLDEVQSLWKENGIVNGDIEFETDTRITSLSGLSKNEVNHATQSIVDEAGLVVPQWKKDQQDEGQKTENTVRAGLAGAGAIVGVGGFLFGLIFILLGVVLSLTIIGAIIGVPLIIFGWWICYTSGLTGVLGVSALSGVSSGESEWVKPSDKEQIPQDDTDSLSKSEQPQKPKKEIQQEYQKTSSGFDSKVLLYLLIGLVSWLLVFILFL